MRRVSASSTELQLLLFSLPDAENNVFFLKTTANFHPSECVEEVGAFIDIWDVPLFLSLSSYFFVSNLPPTVRGERKVMRGRKINT